MAPNKIPFQPGTILHEVIAGFFRATCTSFEVWCRENDIHPSTARNATYGQSSGERGAELRERIIDAAGRDLVAAAYRQRMLAEARRLELSPPAIERGAVAA
ncbi:hypothetical protein M3P21_18790 [Ruegeria sp. 2012CJ41-6]|uniref:Uncharacterized protein n=1 Tax=Ruegeria spongiae TaxID=2942209 RepID=A0ABT0Q6S5_9RHOB|nr:hypothetical protein [Ruegeria spongiae]MCL6285581.1 hypothetical protein [Ruegeria spongiae]